MSIDNLPESKRLFYTTFINFAIIGLFFKKWGARNKQLYPFAV